MDRSVVLCLRDVAKKYRLFGSNLDRLKEALHPFRKKYHHEFWALQDVNLEVRQGDTLGILGLNGSGKSTLLQILSSILQPSRGTVEVHGRLTALLELGAGFTPQLTGRENAELFCTLSGLTGKNLAPRVQAIEQFADIGQFIDQPVQNYSSGMFMRLAFAAAIHVNPDILVLDEVLAVGDARFQHKCFAKFHEFQEKGKTILLVTHSPDAVARHCNRAIVLDQGRIVMDSEPHAAIKHYYQLVFPSETLTESLPTKVSQDPYVIGDTESLPPEMFSLGSSKDNLPQRPNYNPGENRFGNGAALILDAAIVADSQVDKVHIASGQTADIYLHLRFNQIVTQPVYGFNITTVDCVVLYGVKTLELGQKVTPVQAGAEVIVKMSMTLPFQIGDYFIDLGVGCMQNDKFIAMDARHSSLSVHITSGSKFFGLINLDPEITEVYRGKSL